MRGMPIEHGIRFSTLTRELDAWGRGDVALHWAFAVLLFFSSLSYRQLFPTPITQILSQSSISEASGGFSPEHGPLTCFA